MLHVLNGDSLNKSFKASGIGGEVVIWREGLATGPVAFQFDENFYNKRKFFWQQYNSDLNPDLPVYHDHFVPQFNFLIANLQAGVTLWFEHDLFCQINMVAAIAQLGSQTPISLISIDHHDAHPNFKGLGNLDPEELFLLQDIAVNLTTEEIQFAANVWRLFCLSTPLNLQDALGSKFPTAFPFLKKALKMHFQRFPRVANGLNAIQHNILTRIRLPIQRRSLLQEVLSDDYLYGFGDLEFNAIIEGLSHYYDSKDSMIVINQRGKQLLSNEIDFFSRQISDHWLGGTLITNNHQYRMDSSQKLIEHRR